MNIWGRDEETMIPEFNVENLVRRKKKKRKKKKKGNKHRHIKDVRNRDN